MAQQRSTQRLLAFGVFLAFTTLALANASADEQLQTPRTWLFRRQESELQECETPLSGDLYGLGVRLGIYFSWISSWISNSWIPDEIAGGLDANAIFLLTLVIAVLNATASQEIMQIDAVIMLMLSAGTTVGVLSIWGFRTCHYRKDGTIAIRNYGGFGTSIRLILSGMVAVYSLWFFSKGLSGKVKANDLADPSLGCDKVNILTVPLQTAKIAVDVLSSISVLYTGVMFLFSPIGLFIKAKKFLTLGKGYRWSKDSKLRFATGLNNNELKLVSKYATIFSGLWILFSMVVVEFTLNQNRVRGVLGENGDIAAPGQLIPMLVGAFSFLRILFIAFEMWLRPDDDDEEEAPPPVIGRTVGRAVMAPRGMLPRQDTRKSNGEVDQRDEYAQECTLWQRILVTWIPYLTLLRGWPLPAKKGLPTTEPRTSTHLDEKYIEEGRPQTRDGVSQRSFDPASKEPLIDAKATATATGSSSLTASLVEPVARSSSDAVKSRDNK